MIIDSILQYLNLRHSTSFMEWSEKVIAFLAVTGYQEFMPLLVAATSSKDVIESEAMFKGVVSGLVENIKKKEADKLKVQAENREDEVKKLTETIPKLKKNGSNKNNSAQSGLLPALHSSSCDFRGSNCHSQKDHAFQIQIQAQPLDSTFGAKRLINLQDHQKPGRSDCSSRSCHL